MGIIIDRNELERLMPSIKGAKPQQPPKTVLVSTGKFVDGSTATVTFECWGSSEKK